MKQQFFVTYTICQTEIHTLLDSWVTNKSAVKILYLQKLLLLMFCQVFSVSCKDGYQRVKTLLLFHELHTVFTVFLSLDHLLRSCDFYVSIRILKYA